MRTLAAIAGGLLRPHANKVRLWCHEFVNVIVLAHSIFDLGPGCCAFSLGGLHQQLRYLRQQVPDVLHGHRERGESPLDPRRFDGHVTKPSIAVHSLQHDRVAKREQTGVTERRLGRSGVAARDPHR